MLTPNGEEHLKHFTATACPRTVTEVVSNTIFHVKGHGHSKASFVVADDSIDAFDSGE